MELSDRLSGGFGGGRCRSTRSADRVRIAATLSLAATSALTARRLLAPRESLPKPQAVRVEDYFSAEEIRAGRRYARPQLALGLARTAVEVATLTALVSRHAPAGSIPANAPRTRLPTPVREHAAVADALAACTYAAGLTAALTALKLPLSTVARQRSLSVGLSTQSWRAWGEDLAKSTALEVGLTGAVVGASSAVASRWPRTWWLPVSGGVVVVGTLAGMLAPVLTDPIFNRFEPLPEGETRRDVLGLAEAAGVKVGEVYSVDASKRTTAVNAYVNGLGPTKRVVLFDTLIADCSRDEIRFVVAHELGHVRHRDVQRQIAFLALSAPATALAAQQLTHAWAGQLTGARAVPALSLSLWVVGVPLGLSGIALSRAVERRTDQFGLKLSDAPEALISFFRRIAVQNRADVTAGRVTRGLLSTHPPISERMGAALTYQRSIEERLQGRTLAGS